MVPLRLPIGVIEETTAGEPRMRRLLLRRLARSGIFNRPAVSIYKRFFAEEGAREFTEAPTGAVAIDERNALYREVQRNGGFDPSLGKIFRTVIRPGHVVFDVGAHVGLYTVLFSRLVGESGKVFCFEPVEYNRARLQRNLQLNACTNVTMLDKGAGEKTGRVKFHRVEPASPNTGVGTILGSNYFHRHRDLFEETEIDLVTVDEIAESHDVKVDFLKIDVEGYELHVLKGAQAALAHATTIVLEFLWSQIPHTGVSAKDYADYLLKDYECFEIFPLFAGAACPVYLRPYGFDRPNKGENLLCLPRH